MEKNQEHPDFDAVMADQAVTNIAGWTEPNTDDECDEEAYRARLAKMDPSSSRLRLRYSNLSKSPTTIIKAVPPEKVLNRLQSLSYSIAIQAIQKMKMTGKVNVACPECGANPTVNLTKHRLDVYCPGGFVRTGEIYD